jgi:hypothetical protein
LHAAIFFFQSRWADELGNTEAGSLDFRGLQARFSANKSRPKAPSFIFHLPDSFARHHFISIPYPTTYEGRFFFFKVATGVTRMLQRLPKDILLLVLNEVQGLTLTALRYLRFNAEQIPNRNDVKRLCEVSKMLYDFAIPKLSETIIIDARDESQLENLNVQPFLGADAIAKGNLAYVKHVQVGSKFHHKLEARCVHYNDLDDHEWDREIAEQTRFADLTFNLLQVLQIILRLAPHTLLITELQFSLTSKHQLDIKLIDGHVAGR